jgi:cytochrome P450
MTATDPTVTSGAATSGAATTGAARLADHPADWPVPAYLDDPFPFWQLCRDEFPVWRNPVTDQWHITRYHDVVAVFGDSETWSNRFYAKSLGVVFGPTMLEMDGRDHVVRRTIIAPEVVGRRLDGYRELITRNAEELLGAIVARGDGRADLVQEFTTWLPVNVICDMLGLPKDQMPLYHDCYQRMMKGLSAFDKAAQADGIAAARAFAASVAPIVAERRRNPGDDFISRVLTAQVEGEQLSEAEVQAFLALLLTAGGETTDKAMANLWANLLADPEQLGLVVDDPARLDDAFGETMRHSFPVHSQARTATRDLELHGVTIAEGDVVTISIGSANNDERVFDDPRRFDLRRSDLWKAKELRKGHLDGPPWGHLGFGLGKHFCLGYEMARAEAVMGSELLLATLADLRLEDGFVPRQRIMGSTRSLGSLPVRWG